jgi:hypothetical protein
MAIVAPLPQSRSQRQRVISLHHVLRLPNVPSLGVGPSLFLAISARLLVPDP